MAAREVHLFIDRKHLGKEFGDVHRWLDELYAKFGGLHRRHRHTKEGVEEVRRMWGDEAAHAAELHILLDMGHVPSEEHWAKAVSSTMDGMGRLAEYIDRFKACCDDVSLSIAFHGKFPCQHCRRDTLQRLTEPTQSLFWCSICQRSNVVPDYRLDARPPY